MSLTPCSACGQREPRGAKLTHVTWAWWTAEQRVAWRQKLCRACFVERVAPLYINSQDDALVCPACGIGTVDDMDPVYATFYPAGVGETRMECPTCAACAVRIRLRAEEGGVRLENRDPSGLGQGPEPKPDTTEILRGLGILLDRQ
jgi:hypothetical protein